MTKLGFLYRKYLKGSDLKGQSHTVEILAVKQVTVRPRPQEPPVQKWCLFVTGLPEDYPNGILFGPQVERQLLEIFGPVDLDKLKGKKIVIRPVAMKVAGKRLQAIRFAAVNGAQPANPEPDDDIPF